ncbi:MAG: hypothetical protein NC337_09260 [Roseburia sp.]|nr:hypothetical protein [Roseburia sp.]MCM1235817.1 hypothetical protein [Ruminococcus flavefaciens]
MVNKVNGNNYYTYNRQKSINVSDTGEKFSLDYNRDGLQTDSKKDKSKDTEENGVRLELSGSGQPTAKPVETTVSRVPAAKASATAKQPTLLGTLQELLTSLFSAIGSFFSKLWNEPAPDEVKDSTEASVEAQDAEVFAEAGQAEPDTENIQANAVELTQEDVFEQAVNAFFAEKLQETDSSAALSEASETDIDLTEEDAETAYRMSRERLEEEIRPYLRNKDMAQVINILTDNGNRTVAKNSSLLTYYDKRGRITEPTASDRERILYGDKNARNL